MATTGTGQTSQGGGATEWGATGEARDRRPAGEGGGIKQTLRDTTKRSLDSQKDRAVDTLGSLAGAVRGMTQPLRDGGQSNIAEYVNKAADGIERWSSDLRQKDLEDAMRAVQEFARRQPALFLGIAFSAGVIAARFLKSTPSGEYDRYAHADWDSTGRMGDTGRMSETGRMGGTQTSGTGTTYAGSTSGTGPTGIGATGSAAQFGTTSGDIPRVSTDTRREGEVL